MTLCVCGHPSEQHHQYDAGWYCEGDCACDWYRKAADSEESTASLPAGVTPEGLAGATVAGSVNRGGEGGVVTENRCPTCNGKGYTQAVFHDDPCLVAGVEECQECGGTGDFIPVHDSLMTWGVNLALDEVWRRLPAQPR